LIALAFKTNKDSMCREGRWEIRRVTYIFW